MLNTKYIFIGIVLIISLISSGLYFELRNNKDITERNKIGQAPELQTATSSENAPPDVKDVKCPDSICDDFEKNNNACPQDCGGSAEDTQQTQLLKPLNQQTAAPTGAISVKAAKSNYKTAVSKTAGSFKTGQEADIMLSGIDFNNAGGSLLFNHPGNIASDGQRLVLADRNNNRILIWNNLPVGNETPDIVLGQLNFYSNNPGATLDKLNWPIGVSLAQGKLVVADTYNDRILIWNTFPSRNGQPADIEIADPVPGPSGDIKLNISWPWAVWTDGKKLVVTATGAGAILIWNTFPTKNNEPAEISIYIPKEIGTPRTVASDGKHLVVGDHNLGEQGSQGTVFWKNFPISDNQPYDFAVREISQMGQIASKNGSLGSLLWGPTITLDGKLLGLSDKIYIWKSFPENDADAPDLAIGASPNMQGGYDFGGGQSGDGTGLTLAGNKIYISLSNGNKIVGFNSLPTVRSQNPDFAIGAANININPLLTNHFAANPKPATDGRSLFVGGAFERRLYVWKNLPDESGAQPDFVYDNVSVDAITIIDGSLLVVGNGNLYIWHKLPLAGEMPDLITKKIGTVSFETVGGIAKDQKYFYASDVVKNKLYVWDSNPLKNPSSAKYVVDIESPASFTANGKYLAFGGNKPRFYSIGSLPNLEKMAITGTHFNLPGDALLYGDKLFVADTVFNRVQIWNSADSAFSGKGPDAILGQKNSDDIKPAIGKNRLFWPNALAFDGSFLWVGEFKFSSRVLRFSLQP